MIKIFDTIRIKDLLRISWGLILLTIIIAVCSLLLLFSINEAGKKEMVENIKKEGNVHLLFLEGNVLAKNGKKIGMLSSNDIDLLKNRVRRIDKVAWWVFRNIYGFQIDSKEYPPAGASFSVIPIMGGITPEFRDVMGLKLMEGRFIDKTDLIYKRRVCLIGGKLYERLGGKNLIGKTLILKEDIDKEIGSFTIIGRIQKKMSLFASLPDRVLDSFAFLYFKSTENIELFQRQQKFISSIVINETIFIPSTTWQNFNGAGGTMIPMKVTITEGLGKFIKDEENIIKEEQNMCADSTDSFEYYFPEKIKELNDEIRKVLKEKWGNDKVFLFSYNGSLIDEIEIQTKEANKLLGIITILTLFLSGVILNSMMVISVRKRIGEIGVCRAFGARKKDIFLQFLAEGVVIYSVGIIGGILLGGIISYILIVRILLWKYSLPVYSVILSSVFSFLVGVLSSLYPAFFASRIPPAQAVKYE